MPYLKTLAPIRKTPTSLKPKQYLLHGGLCLVLGVLFGIMAKYVDTVPANGWTGQLVNLVSHLTSSIGLWVFIATVLAVKSHHPRLAAIKVFSFFVGLLLAYYLYSMILFGFFPTYYFIRWGAIALASPLAAYLVWYGGGKGWIAACLSALPIGLLITTGYPFLYTFSITHGLELILAFILVPIFSTTHRQWLRLIIPTLLVVLILRHTSLLAFLFGGL